MEEYKYHLIENVGGDNGLLRTYLDSLSLLERRRAYSLRLEDGSLTVGWAGWVPPSWRDRKTVILLDGTVVALTNETLDGLRLAPSLVEALGYLIRAKETNQTPEAPHPEKLAEKMDALDRCGMIEVEYEM